MEPEFRAMLYFLFPDELLFLYVDADDAGLSGGSFGDQYGKCGDALSSYTIGLLCVRPFSGFLVDCFSRKPLYLFAFFVFAFMFGGYLIATTMLTIMAVRFIQGGFMGLTRLPEIRLRSM